VRWIVCLLASVLALQADTVLGEVTRAGVSQKGVRVTSGSFREGYVVRLAQAELAKKSHPNFVRVDIYGDKGGAPLPKPPGDLTYGYWRRLYEAQRGLQNELAEMISIGTNAVLRMRDAGGKVSRRVLAGRDPLQLEVQGDRLEIVYFGFSAPGPYILQCVDVYIRTDASLRTEVGLELLGALRPIFPDLEVSVSLRNDAWFILEPSYPFYNPLIEDQQPPTEEEYRKNRTLRCGYWTGSASCRLR
jgi:hypothetical protein